MIKIYGVEMISCQEDWVDAVKFMKEDLRKGDESIIALVAKDGSLPRLAEGVFELPERPGAVKMVPCERYNKELLDSLGLPY